MGIEKEEIEGMEDSVVTEASKRALEDSVQEILAIQVIADLERCSMRHVASVTSHARSHFAQMEADQSIVIIALVLPEEKRTIFQGKRIFQCDLNSSPIQMSRGRTISRSR